MPIFADESGRVRGKFQIPAKVRAGSKLVEFTGGGGSRGSTTFMGAGTQEDIVKYRVTWIGIGIDPLAQTFSLLRKTQIAGVDLWFTAKGSTRIVVQIRETEVGFPTRNVLAQVYVDVNTIKVGQMNRIMFPWPATLQKDVEYALVVLCDDAVSMLGTAELGKWDLTGGSWVTSQPYQIGTLLSSSNASTWTAHQDKDLTFRLLSYRYTQLERKVDLGTTYVTDATDLMVKADQEIPDETTRIDYVLTLPDNTQLTVASEQPVQLQAPVTGDVRVEAVLHGSEHFSPTLFPDTVLLHGTISHEGNYVSRAMLAGMNSRVRVIYEALLPSGSTCKVKISGTDEGDTWSEMPSISNSPLDNGWREFVHEVNGISKDMVKTMIELQGNTAARPYVRELRILVM